MAEKPPSTHAGLLKKTTAADRGRVERPTLTPHLEFRDIGDGKMLLVSESFNTLLDGRLYAELLPLLDGRRSRGDVIAALAGAHSETAVRARLGSLVSRGYVVSADHAMERGAAAFWSSLGASPRWVEERLRISTVALHGDDGSLARRLEAMGVAVGEGSPALTVVVCEDYLDPRHAEANQRQLASGAPWMLVRPKGVQDAVRTGLPSRRGRAVLGLSRLSPARPPRDPQLPAQPRRRRPPPSVHARPSRRCWTRCAASWSWRSPSGW